MNASKEQIVKLSLECYTKLPKTGKPNEKEWTVLSTIVQENSLESKLEVVALGTGTKCLGRNQLKNSGEVLNDSHAEVICRRAFICYIYSELLKENGIFYLTNEKKFVLKDSIKFHFFSSHVPCGDASLYSENSDSNEEIGVVIEMQEEPPEKKPRLSLTGAKCLPDDNKLDKRSDKGRIFQTGAIRTKPGKGDPTLSVSCSDKLSKWCHLGIQGSLLSLFLEKPIYLSSITIASDFFNESALRRALYGRFSTLTIQPLEPFVLNVPEVFHGENMTFNFATSNDKQPCPSSIIFVKDIRLEVSVEGCKQGVTKKNRGKPCGRLKICKLELLRSFFEISKKHCLGFCENECYGSLKKSSEYHKAKELLIKNQFKIWTNKPNELECFKIHD